MYSSRAQKSLQNSIQTASYLEAFCGSRPLHYPWWAAEATSTRFETNLEGQNLLFLHVPRVIFQKAYSFLVVVLSVVSCISETRQTRFMTFAFHYSGLSMLEATLSEMLPSTSVHYIVPGKSYLGRPCIFSIFCRMDLTCFLPTGGSLSNPTIPALLSGQPQTVFNSACIALPLRRVWGEGTPQRPTAWPGNVHDP